VQDLHEGGVAFEPGIPHRGREAYVVVLIYLGGAQAAGLIAGASKPVVMLSRADSKQQKINSIALGVVSC